MSGHSKWSTIKRKKGAADAKRGALFTKLGKEIMSAARESGADTESNFKLRLAIQRARQSNMPKDNIDRAIAKGSGTGNDGVIMEEMSYEGYGPGGIAILVSVVTDNKNRTVAEVRHQFTRAGGNLGETGSVAWQFESKGTISIALGDSDGDDIALQAIDAGAEDVQVQEESVEVQTDPDTLDEVRKALENSGLSLENVDFGMMPKATIMLDDNLAMQALRLLDGLEELEDVQRVYSNADFSDEALANYAA